jgi:hypothetical protein
VVVCEVKKWAEEVGQDLTGEKFYMMLLLGGNE